MNTQQKPIFICMDCNKKYEFDPCIRYLVFLDGHTCDVCGITIWKANLPINQEPENEKP